MKCFIIALVMGVLISGCVIHTSAIMLDQAEQYSPSSSVQILYEPPTTDYREIAIIESIGPSGILLPELLEDMRLKAMSLGADAIILRGTSKDSGSQGLMFNPVLGGYQTVGGGSRTTATGIAIRYN